MKIAELPIPFVKMSGTGNDFIIIDHRKPKIALEGMQEFARRVCRRKFSVGADGLFLLEPSEVADFKWRFFNSDGSIAEMCGNGARCVARFAYMHGIASARMQFETLAGIIEASVFDIYVSVRMTPPQNLLLDQKLSVEGREFQYHSVDTGVPHVVVFVDDVDRTDVVTLGRAIRFHKRFHPAGTNVNFAGQRGGGFKVRTYERGVEDETMACGTGAVASALISALHFSASAPVEITTSGEDTLTILFDITDGTEIKNVFLKGPTRVVYKGELTAEALVE